MKYVFLCLLFTAGSLHALDAEALRKIAAEPHSRENLVPELKLYPDAREYKIRVRAGKSAKELAEIPEMTVTEKTVQGRYLVSVINVPEQENPIIMAVSYDSEADLFKKWVLVPEGKVASSTGLADLKTRTIAWTSDNAEAGEPRILSLEIHSDEKSTWKETILVDGKVLSVNQGEAVKSK